MPTAAGSLQILTPGRESATPSASGRNSASSSRSSSPLVIGRNRFPSDGRSRSAAEANAPMSQSSEVLTEPTHSGLGRQDDAFYANILPAWRMKVRQAAVRSLEREMPYLQAIQAKFRTPLLDIYFVQTSLLGTHAAFMICVPIWFWFGQSDVGRGLIFILATGGYLTSVLKDLCCVPRPYSPPVSRLSVGNHALEYGFPSTHSANSVSMGLYFAVVVARYGNYNDLVSGGLYFLLAWLAFSVVFGRLYTGMHSIVDVSVGALIGILCWGVWFLVEDYITHLTVNSGSLLATFTVVPTLLFLVFVHPAPAEDCPCFEDAVAFLSVISGIFLGHNWDPTGYENMTIYANSVDPVGQATWIIATTSKVIIGVLLIFTWRLVAKEACHAIIPPIFRVFSSYLLPRPFYVKATEYESYEKQDGLHPVPSILDLPSLVDEEGMSVPAGEDGTTKMNLNLRNRNGYSEIGDDSFEDPLQLKANHSNKIRPSPTTLQSTAASEKSVDASEAFRRDADVLTKVIVYFGIGWIATKGVPWLFLSVGLSE